jgi:hypothetical protein
VPGAVLAPPAHGGHVGQTPIGSVPFEELRVLGGVVRLPLDGANADVEAGELPLPGLLELLGPWAGFGRHEGRYALCARICLKGASRSTREVPRIPLPRTTVNKGKRGQSWGLLFSLSVLPPMSRCRRS